MEKGFQRCALLVTLSIFFFFIPASFSVPFIFFHGFEDECSHLRVRIFTELLIKSSGSPGSCLEIGNGSKDTITMPLMQQASFACEKVKQMKELSQGYNIVAESQGNLVARGVIEFCDNAPPVFNYISLAGPHAGITRIPMCSNPLCGLLTKGVYTDYVQRLIAPSAYIKIPTQITQYLEHSKYLPKLNNERPEERNSTYKERFTSLHKLVLVLYLNDLVLIPKETSWFGYYPDGSLASLLSPRQTRLYTEDWIGLKTLDEAGKVKFVAVAGHHVNMAVGDVMRYVVPYLKN